MVKVDKRPFAPLDRFAIADANIIPIINIGNYSDTDLPQIALSCAYSVVNHRSQSIQPLSSLAENSNH